MLEHKVGDLLMATEWDDNDNEYVTVGIISKVIKIPSSFRYKIDWVDGKGLDEYNKANVDTYRKKYLNYVERTRT